MAVTEALQGSYDYRLVVLSVLIATLASYAALDLAGLRLVAPSDGQGCVLICLCDRPVDSMFMR